MKFLKLAPASAALFLSTSVNAAFIFSDINATTNSITFTIDGDMTGYTTGSLNDQFSIRYSDSIYNESLLGSYTSNAWSSSVFDNISLADYGNTGDFGHPSAYTWSDYNVDLTGAISSNRTVTITSGTNFLHDGATGQIEFLWGNGSDLSSALLGQATITVSGGPISIIPTPITPPSTIPVPAAAWLFGSGLIGLAGFARRKKA